MNCPRCHKPSIPDAAYCPYCGKKLSPSVRKPKHSPNGTGCAYKRGNSWEVQIVIDYAPLPPFDINNPENKRQRVPIKIRRGGYKTKALALADVPKIRAEYIASQAKTYTLRQIYDLWEPWYTPRIGASTMAGYRSAFKHYAKLHDTDITKISASDLQQCVDDCPAGKRTRQQMKVVAGLLWKYAKSMHIVSQVESEILFTGRGQSVKRPPLTDIEVEKIRQAIGQHRYAEYIYCLCYLGFRPGEMLEIRKDQVIEHKGRLFIVEGKKTEAGIGRTVPVHQKIEQLIRDRLYIPGTDLVFPQYSFSKASKKRPEPIFTGFKQMTDDYLREMVFKPLCGRLGIAEGKVPYAARHTFSNKLKAAAGDDRDKAALIGHSDYTFTQTKYQDTNESELLAVVDSMK